jgi:hypothetical protein
MATQHFAGMETSLVHRVAVYVPGTVAVDRPAAQVQQAWTDQMLDAFGTLYGGSTAISVLGTWIGTGGKLVREPVNLVYSYCSDEQLAHSRPAVLRLAKSMAVEMGQEAVALDVDNALFLVVP